MTEEEIKVRGKKYDEAENLITQQIRDFFLHRATSEQQLEIARSIFNYWDEYGPIESSEEINKMWDWWKNKDWLK